MSGYEYLDHPADIQFHSWGPTVEQAFEQICLAMMNYSVDLASVDIDPSCDQEFEVDGVDSENLLFRYLDEFLFRFQSEHFIAKEIKIIEMKMTDEDNFYIKGNAKGEKLDFGKHDRGADIKAITYSAMRIEKIDDQHHVYVVVDI
ncbi:hypothetical protein RCL1_001561 [Eukaryota sp. TZLM3-RCL]